MKNSKNLANLLNEAIDLRNLNIEKLSELTDIPPHYLEALTSGDFSKLPPAPYVRGYLTKIAEILRVNAEPFLKAHKEEAFIKPLKISGASDKLPANRYALSVSRKKTIIVIGVVFVLIAVSFVLFGNGFFGTPKIEIISPAANNLIIHEQTIKLSGEINPKDKLMINGEEIFTESGRFEKDFSLQPGINTIEFRVKRFLGKETKVIRQVIYQ